MIMELIRPGTSPPLPEGFAEAHDLKKVATDDSRFSTLEEYNKLWDAQRAATKSILDSIDEGELDSNKGGTLPEWLANVGCRLQRGRPPRR